MTDKEIVLSYGKICKGGDSFCYLRNNFGGVVGDTVFSCRNYTVILGIIKTTMMLAIRNIYENR